MIDPLGQMLGSRGTGKTTLLDHEDRIQLLRQTLARIGWTTDVALRKLGDGGVFASAEDWMLPGA